MITVRITGNSKRELAMFRITKLQTSHEGLVEYATQMVIDQGSEINLYTRRFQQLDTEENIIELVIQALETLAGEGIVIKDDITLSTLEIE